MQEMCVEGSSRLSAYKLRPIWLRQKDRFFWANWAFDIDPFSGIKSPTFITPLITFIKGELTILIEATPIPYAVKKGIHASEPTRVSILNRVLAK